MYSKKLQQWLDANRPATMELSAEKTRQLVLDAGLEMYTSIEALQLGRVVFSHEVQDEDLLVVSWAEGSKPRRVQKGLFSKKEKIELPSDKLEFEYVVLKSGQASISWQKQIEGDRVVYNPWLISKSAGGVGVEKKIGDALIEQMGLKPISVPLPEPLVSLPLVPWTHVLGDDWTANAWAEGETCFKSEVAGYVEPFVAELQKFLE